MTGWILGVGVAIIAKRCGVFMDALEYFLVPMSMAIFGGIAGAIGAVIGRAMIGACFGAASVLLLHIPEIYNHGLPSREVGIWFGSAAILVGAITGAMGGTIARRLARNPRFQFSLKTLLLLVVLCAVACSLPALQEQLHHLSPWNVKKAPPVKKQKKPRAERDLEPPQDVPREVPIEKTRIP